MVLANHGAKPQEKGKEAPQPDVVYSTKSVDIVASWLGMTREAILGDVSAAAQRDEEARRPARLGLGAKHTAQPKVSERYTTCLRDISQVIPSIPCPTLNDMSSRCVHHHHFHLYRLRHPVVRVFVLHSCRSSSQTGTAAAQYTVESRLASKFKAQQERTKADGATDRAGGTAGGANMNVRRGGGWGQSAHIDDDDDEEEDDILAVKMGGRRVRGNGGMQRHQPGQTTSGNSSKGGGKLVAMSRDDLLGVKTAPTKKKNKKKKKKNNNNTCTNIAAANTHEHDGNSQDGRNTRE